MQKVQCFAGASPDPRIYRPTHGRGICNRLGPVPKQVASESEDGHRATRKPEPRACARTAMPVTQGQGQRIRVHTLHSCGPGGKWI
jgi:hypothetical protein